MGNGKGGCTSSKKEKLIKKLSESKKESRALFLYFKQTEYQKKRKNFTSSVSIPNVGSIV